jgi:signal transduction histidine kinase
MSKSLKDLVENIRCSIDILVSIKLKEELEKYKFDNDKPGAVQDYEKLLQKLEQNIREHISIEHQLKIQCEKYADTLDNMEEDRLLLVTQMVRYFHLIPYIIL